MKIAELLVSEQTIQPVGPTITPTPAQTSTTNTTTSSAKLPVPPGQQIGQPPGAAVPPVVNSAKAAQVQSLSTQIAQLQTRLTALNTQP